MYLIVNCWIFGLLVKSIIKGPSVIHVPDKTCLIKEFEQKLNCKGDSGSKVNLTNGIIARFCI